MGRPCPDCGGHRWSFLGYCLEIPCAGYYWEDDYPKSAPDSVKNQRNKHKEKNSSKYKDEHGMLRPRTAQGAKEAELYYESLGKKAPWLT